MWLIAIQICNCCPALIFWNSNLLEDSIIHQELGRQRRQQGDADPQAKATAGAVKSPPQTDGEGRQSQRQLDVIGKVHFLTEVGSRTKR